MAECIQRKKKELVTSNAGIKQFESQLRVQKDHLNKMDCMAQLEERQEKKIIALYMGEKVKREEELAKELRWERKVAERKRQEERERVKERLAQKQKQEEESKRKAEQKQSVTEKDKRSNAEGDSAESFCEEEEEDRGSLKFSSSISSTASLLEHIRSIGGWTSESQQHKDKAGKESKDDKKTPTKDDTKKKQDGSKVEPSRNGAKSKGTQQQSLTERISVLTTSADILPETTPKLSQQDSNDSKIPQTPPQNSPRVPDKDETNLQQENHTPRAHASKLSNHQPTSDQTHSSTAQGKPVKNQNKPSRHKTDLSKHTQLEDPQKKPKAQRPLSTGLHVPKPVLKVRNASLSQETPQYTADKTSSRGSYVYMQKNTQPTKPPAEHKIAKQRSPNYRRVHVQQNPPITRRVASSEALLEDVSSRTAKESWQMGPARQPLSTGMTLANAPPTLRKSIGCLGEFDDNAGHYDVLKSRDAAPMLSQPDASSYYQQGAPPVIRNDWLSRGGRGLQIPTFPNTRPESDRGVQSSKAYNQQFSNSQPDNFAFSSNPAYETGMVAKRSLKAAMTEERARQQRARLSSGKELEEKIITEKPEAITAPQNRRPAQLQRPQSRPHIPQHTPHPLSPSVKSGGAVVHHSYTQFSVKPKPSGKAAPQKTPSQMKIQPGFGSHNLVLESESDSSENRPRLRSSSDKAATRHSSVSANSGQQSSSSEFSSGGHSETTAATHQTRSQRAASKLPNTANYSPQQLRDNRRNPSGLQAPRKRCESQPHDQRGTSHGLRRLAPQPPPHAQPSHIPAQHHHHAHDEAALTSYPRFQRQDNHRVRAQDGRSHRTKQLDVLPGTGQIAQLCKQEHSTVHHQQHQLQPTSNRNPDVGSLV